MRQVFSYIQYTCTIEFVVYYYSHSQPPVFSHYQVLYQFCSQMKFFMSYQFKSCVFIVSHMKYHKWMNDVDNNDQSTQQFIHAYKSDLCVMKEFFQQSFIINQYTKTES